MTSDDEERDADGRLLSRPGMPFREIFPWAAYTDNPKVLHCTVCNTDVPKFYMAIMRHADKHPPVQK